MIHDIDIEQLTGVLLVNLEELVDLLTNLTVGHADIVLGVTVVVHEGEEAIVRDVELQKCVNKSQAPSFLPISLKFSFWNQDRLTSWYSRRVTLGTSML